MRKKTREVKIGKIKIGGDNPIAVQSMLSKPSDNIQENINQAKELESAGCDIIRVSVPDYDNIKLIHKLKENIKIPVVADIHLDYKLVLECVYAGADKVRINPGNIETEKYIKSIANMCNNYNVPIRVGVNSGSLEKNILEKYGKICPEAMCDSALYNIKLLEKYDFNNIVISLKSSDVIMMIEAYRQMSEICDYPLHIGVTEAGTEKMGVIKSSIGIGSLLIDGIGDTIRVSLTEDPVKEVHTGINILKSLNMYRNSINIVSCPTCGRTKIDIMNITKQVEEILESQEIAKNIKKNIKVAIMGCVVNGPGEAKDADVGIAGGNKYGVLFKHGQVIKKIPEQDLVSELIQEIKNMIL